MFNIKKIMIISICVIFLTAAAFGIRYLISVNQYKKIVQNIKISNTDISKVTDGEYLGSCDALFIKASVKVTVFNHNISKIDLIEHKNGRGKNAEVIPEKVIKAQSLSVDTVTGATNSSKVILKAIENALEKGEMHE